jgi:hypothetical protein
MHEKDHLDQVLESSLSSYGDPGADTGLAERILARVSSEKKSNEPTPRWRSRFLLWAALPAAACLLLSFFLLKSAGPLATHPSARLPQTASTAPKSTPPGLSGVVPAQRTHRSAPRRTESRPTVAFAKSAPRPKLDVFPQPQPLSSQEQALYAFATQVPEEQRRAVMAARKNDDAPLNIAAISIQPLEVPDTGKN